MNYRGQNQETKCNNMQRSSYWSVFCSDNITIQPLLQAENMKYLKDGELVMQVSHTFLECTQVLLLLIVYWRCKHSHWL